MSGHSTQSAPPPPSQSLLGQDERLGELLAIIEEMRVNSMEEFECPGVLVIGSQSVGKSSLMERLTGISFPRGDGICTRTPINVQILKHRESRRRFFVSTDARFDPKNCTEYSSMENLSSGIREYMQSCLNRAEISTNPVYVRIYNTQESNSHALTLIDLPGMTEISITSKGTPEFSISQTTEDLVGEYIKNENMVILVVIAAVDDFSTSKALRMAMQYDKEGERTIGVATKIDFLPPEGDFEDKMLMRRGNDVRLKMGFFAVRNKRLSEVNVDIDRIETELYSTHDQLKSLRHEDLGFSALREKVYRVQRSYVDRFIPKVMRNVNEALMSIDFDLGKIKAVGDDPGERLSILAKVLREIDKEIDDLVLANIIDEEDERVNICDWMRQLALNFKKELKVAVVEKVLLGEECTRITKKLMEQSVGRSLPNLSGEIPVKNLIKRLFFDGFLKKRINDLIENTTSNISYVFQHCINNKKELQPLPLLRSFLSECTSLCLHDEAQNARTMTNAIHEAEAERLDTLDENYLTELGSVISRARGRAAEKLRELYPPVSMEDSGSLRSGGDDDREPINDHMTSTIPDRTSNPYNDNNITGMDAERFWNYSGRNDQLFVLTEFIDRYAEAIVQDGQNHGSRMMENVAEMQLSAYIYADVIIRRLADVIPMLVHSLIVRGMNRIFHTNALEKYDAARREGKDLFVESRDTEDKRKALQERKNHLMSLKERLTNLM